MYLTRGIYHLFRVMCQLYHVFITCYPRKHGRRSGNRFSVVIWPISIYCMSHLWNATERDCVGVRFAALKIGGVERNRSICRHAQTARRWLTGLVHSRVHTAAPSRRVPFLSTANTSRCGLSVPDEHDAVDAVWTRTTGRILFANTVDSRRHTT